MPVDRHGTGKADQRVEEPKNGSSVGRVPTGSGLTTLSGVRVPPQEPVVKTRSAVAGFFCYGLPRIHPPVGVFRPLLYRAHGRSRSKVPAAQRPLLSGFQDNQAFSGALEDSVCGIISLPVDRHGTGKADQRVEESKNGSSVGRVPTRSGLTTLSGVRVPPQEPVVKTRSAMAGFFCYGLTRIYPPV